MTNMYTSSIRDYVISILVFLIIGFYVLALLVETPYVGFSLNADYSVMDVFVPQESTLLKNQDILLKIGDKNLEKSDSYITDPLFEDVRPGESINLLVERGDQQLTIPWTSPGPNLTEILNHLMLIWVPYVFWGIGTATVLLVRPKNTRWQLLVAFFYMTAVWLIAGIASGLVVTGTTVYRMALWMCVPIYLHLHWVFPKSLGKLPQLLIAILYIVSIILMIGEAFHLLPKNAAMLAVLFAGIGIIILMGIHVIKQPDQRSSMNLILISFILVSIPIFIVAITILLNRPPPSPGRVILTLPTIPVVYFFIIYRRQLGGMELRANRTITLILFSVLLFSLFFSIVLITRTFFLTTEVSLVITAGVTVIVSLIAITTYPRFQQLIERYFLGIQLHPDLIIENYTTRITTSLEEDRLIHLLKYEIFPSLLIRQSALLRIKGVDTNGKSYTIKPIFSMGITETDLPTSDDIPGLLDQSGRIRHRARDNQRQNLPCPWAHLVLPLTVEGDTIGLCLLGRRDPDDYYSQSEIQAQQAMMNQTALALLNIDQAERLHALYQNDIERQEVERSRLARELHDDVLGRMAILAQSIEDNQASEHFLEVYVSCVQQVREIINNLRPTMLSYGLRAGLDQLIDELSTSDGTSHQHPTIISNLPDCRIQYPHDVELHLFRIVQEACNNTFNHAQAEHLFLSGQFGENMVEIDIRDDGVGFDTGEQFDLTGWLINKQFGLAGMYERASLINAVIDISSKRGTGTTISVIWNSQNKIHH